jgi:apolipoprotein N-acyltransferase
LLTKRAASAATAPSPRVSAPGPRQAATVLLSGAALACAFPEPDLAPLAWIALCPLLLLAPSRGAGSGLLAGGLFGLGFFGVLLAWISLVGWVSWAALVCVQAAYVALFGCAWAVVARSERRLVRLLGPPLLWVALVEYLRSVFPARGFPWGQLAQSQHNVSWLLDAAALGGGWLVAWLVVFANAALTEWLVSRRRGRRGDAWLLGAAALALLAPALLPDSPAGGHPLRVAIVQGGIPGGFADDTVAKELAITARHRRLTEDLGGARLDLVVWPESSVGLDIERVPRLAAEVRAAARAVGAPLIVGANLDSGADRYRVAALLVDPAGEVEEVYQKTHLVPFGEYIPARRWLEWIPLLDQIPRDAVVGSEPTLFSVAGGQVAPVISFEADFGPLVRRRIALGGRLLVVATNTSTWGRSWASAQHLAFTRVRAAENGVWVVHAALTGISAFVSPEGAVLASTPLGRAATTVATVRFADSISPYARLGDWLPPVCVVLSAAVVLAGARRGVAPRFRR